MPLAIDEGHDVSEEDRQDDPVDQCPFLLKQGTFELMIAGFGTVLFVGMAFVDFYTMPRTYRDDQYLAGALGMYLTYINLFVFLLRLIIALQGGGRRD